MFPLWSDMFVTVFTKSVHKIYCWSELSLHLYQVRTEILKYKVFLGIFIAIIKSYLSVIRTLEYLSCTKATWNINSKETTLLRVIPTMW